MPRFTMPAGTKCKIRKVGGGEWKGYRTTKPLGFDAHGLADNGGMWTFTAGGWEMKVLPQYVTGRDPKPKQARPKTPTFSGVSKGKGSNRRRRQRASRGKWAG